MKKPTCLNRSRTTAKCRRKCCRKAKTANPDNTRQESLYIMFEKFEYQLNHWRNRRQ